MTPIRLAVIGSNFITDKLLNAVSRTTGIEAVAVYSRAEETGQMFAQKHKIPAVFTDFTTFSQSDCFDAAYVATPNYIHFDQTATLLRNGKHVLCEKPITPDMPTLDALIDITRQSNCVLMEAMRPHYDPAYAILQTYLPKLGTVRRITLEFCQYSSRYDDFRRGVVQNAFRPALCNAALLDIGVYPLHVLCMLFGAPLSVQSSGLTLPNGMDGGGTLLLTYPDFCAEIVYSKVTHSVTPSVISGEAGAITIDKISEPDEMWLQLRDGTTERLPSVRPQNNMVYEVEAFVAAISGQRLYDVERELAVTRITTAVMDEVRRQRGLVFHNACPKE